MLVGLVMRSTNLKFIAHQTVFRILYIMPLYSISTLLIFHHPAALVLDVQELCMPPAGIVSQHSCRPTASHRVERWRYYDSEMLEEVRN